MKIEQIIDEMQASLTKLRGQARDRGKAGDKHFIVNPDCPIHGSYKGTCPPPDCLCTSTTGERTCDECGGKFGHTCYHMGISKPTPDLPLNVRVARALGHACWTDRDGKWRSHMGRFIPNGVEYPFVPDYPNDLEAAMGALEEYCRGKKNYSICYYPDFSKTLRISIWDLGSGGLSEINVNCPPPQAICEAIVAHKEGK